MLTAKEAAPTVVLSPEEVQRAAGGYKQAAKQLAELHRRGFYRAWISKVTGQVVLERPHYDAVSAGTERPQQSRPKVRAPEARPAH